MSGTRDTSPSVSPPHHARPALVRSRPARRVCVYCGASPGNDPAYAEAGRQLGAALAGADLELVYGGGTDGLMGIVAQSVLAHGGHVTGIIPTCLARRGTALAGDHDLIVVDGMHARKQAMFDKADAFVALPGGIGTLEELVEQMTWLKLGHHTKPLIIADIQGFWHPLLQLLDHMDACGFLRAEQRASTQVCRSVEEILVTLRDHLGAPTDRPGAARRAPGFRDRLPDRPVGFSENSPSSSRHDIYPLP